MEDYQEYMDTRTSYELVKCYLSFLIGIGQHIRITNERMHANQMLGLRAFKMEVMATLEKGKG